MIVAALIFAGLAALVHVYIWVMESFLWTSPRTRAVFGTSEEEAQTTKLLALNQGFYNLFLAVITAVGIVFGGCGNYGRRVGPHLRGHRIDGLAARWCCCVVAGQGAFGAGAGHFPGGCDRVAGFGLDDSLRRQAGHCDLDRLCFTGSASSRRGYGHARWGTPSARRVASSPDHRQ